MWGAHTDFPRIQSKDLPETSAQKASSVSPAHFRSALLRARRLLSQVQAQGDTVQSSPSASGSTSASGSGIGTGSRRSSPRKQASTQSHSHQTQTEKGTKDEHQHKSSGPSIDPLSPFQTPKKKFKYSSGIDVSDLLRSGSATGPGSGSGHPHTPTTGSPLRQSQTPRTANGTARERDGVEGVERTPTKRTKFHPRGVDLSTVDVDTDIETDHENENENDNEADADAETISRSGNGAEGKRVTRRRNDMSAFMALRPGSAGTTPKSQPTKDGEGELPEEEQEYLRSIREKRRTHSGQNKGTKRKVNRRDWTCREVVWGSESVDRQNRIEIDKVSGKDLRLRARK